MSRPSTSDAGCASAQRVQQRRKQQQEPGADHFMRSPLALQAPAGRDVRPAAHLLSLRRQRK
jgi:hypothetical protein